MENGKQKGRNVNAVFFRRSETSRHSSPVVEENVW